jgi:hypothetical protein
MGQPRSLVPQRPGSAEHDHRWAEKSREKLIATSITIPIIPTTWFSLFCYLAGRLRGLYLTAAAALQSRIMACLVVQPGTERRLERP